MNDPDRHNRNVKKLTDALGKVDLFSTIENQFVQRRQRGELRYCVKMRLLKLISFHNLQRVYRLFSAAIFFLVLIILTLYCLLGIKIPRCLLVGCRLVTFLSESFMFSQMSNSKFKSLVVICLLYTSPSPRDA